MKTRLLLVEDEPAIREMLGYSLERAGYEVVQAEDVGAARRAVADRIPDLVVLDWMLPDISGEEVEKWLSENGYLEKSDAPADAPINSACTDEQHAAMAAGTFKIPGKIKFLD